MKFGTFFLLLCLVVTSTFACSSGGSTMSPSQIATAQRGDLRVEVSSSGTLVLSDTADVAFDVDGTVEKVLVEDGDLITQGQILVQLDRFGLQVNYRPTTQSGQKSTRSRSVVPWENQKRNLERAVIQAKADLNSVLLDLKRARSSSGANAADPLDMESKKHKVALAEANLSMAQNELERFLQTSPEIKAPYDGFVTKVNVKGGDVISKGTVAVSVAALDKFEAKMLVNEMDVTRIKVGMPATVQVAAFVNTVFPAEVIAISPTATVKGGVVSYQVNARLLSPQDTLSSSTVQPSSQGTVSVNTMQNLIGASGGRVQVISAQEPRSASQIAQLRDGFTATIKILIEEKKGVVLVPNRAIIREGANTSVQVMNSGANQRRPIRTGINNAQFTEVTRGLNEGEQVLIQQLATTPTTWGQPSTNIMRMLR